MGNHERLANADMIEGYLDGAKDDRAEFPESLSNRGLHTVTDGSMDVLIASARRGGAHSMKR